jgi:hypothetical protein
MLDGVGGRGLSHELAGNPQRNMRELCRRDAPLARHASKNAVELRVART